MTILITGAGIVGSHIAHELVKRGERPVLLDIAPIQDGIASIVPLDAVEIITGDMCDFDLVQRVVTEHRIRKIVNTAAILTTAGERDPALAVKVNILAATQLLEFARRGIVERVVLASSSTVTYPTFKTPARTSIPEDFPMRAISERPMSLYSATKLASEFILHIFRDRLGADVVAVRYSAVLGVWGGPVKGIPSRMLDVLLTAGRKGRPAVFDQPTLVWKGGEEFLDARDAALGTIAALEARKPHQGVYTLTVPKLYTFGDVVDAVRVRYPKLSLDMRVAPAGGFAGFPYERTAPSDTSAAARELGFHPRYSLAETISHFAAVGEGCAEFGKE